MSQLFEQKKITLKFLLDSLNSMIMEYALEGVHVNLKIEPFELYGISCPCIGINLIFEKDKSGWNIIPKFECDSCGYIWTACYEDSMETVCFYSCSPGFSASCGLQSTRAIRATIR